MFAGCKEGILDCHCYQLATFKFDVESRDNAALLEGKYEGAPSSVTPQIGPTPAQVSGNDGGPLSVAQTAPTPYEGKLNRADRITHEHVGQYCIVSW